MSKDEWVTWLTFLQTAETLPQDEEEESIAEGEPVKIVKADWKKEDQN